MIRNISSRELEDLLPLASVFYKNFARGSFNAAVFLATWKMLIEARVGFITARFSGRWPVEAIGYVSQPDTITGERAAHSLFWMYKESPGLASGKLYKRVKDDCMASGVIRFTFQVPMCSPKREQFLALLDKDGYEQTETVHTVNLWHSKPQHLSA